jgi:hypothetical protein
MVKIYLDFASNVYNVAKIFWSDVAFTALNIQSFVPFYRIQSQTDTIAIKTVRSSGYYVAPSAKILIGGNTKLYSGILHVCVYYKAAAETAINI